MIQAAMIIHTRTRSCDFPSPLAVYPSALSSGEAEQVRKQILAATRSIDTMRQDDVRYMVYTCGNYVVAGMVSFLKNLAENSADDEKFFADDKGRSIYAFVGFTFRKGHSITPRIDKKVLWDNFKSYMEPVWDRTVLETRTSSLVAMDFPEAGMKEPVGAESVAGQTLSIMSADDADVFSHWLGQALRGKMVSFCSNIADVRVAKEKAFRIITTTTNIITRMKEEAVAPTRHTTGAAHSNVAGSASAGVQQKKNVVRNRNGSDGKTFRGNSNNGCILTGTVILSMLIAMIFLLR